MQQTPPVITLQYLIQRMQQNAELLKNVPEFYDAIKGIAEKSKARGCMCGLSEEYAKVNAAYMNTVTNPSPDFLARMREVFDVTEICFGFQEKHRFDIKCH